MKEAYSLPVKSFFSIRVRWIGLLFVSLSLGASITSFAAGYHLVGEQLLQKKITGNYPFNLLPAGLKNSSWLTTQSKFSLGWQNRNIYEPAWPANFFKTLIACSPVSTLDCGQIQVNLPFKLNFEGNVPQSLADKNGVGTGFTMVDAYTGTRLLADGSPANAVVPGYEPAQLTLTDGTLKLITNKGTALTTNNNQINALGVKVDTHGRLSIETKIINPVVSNQSQQAGIWFGHQDKTYLKLIISGNKVELRREINDVSGPPDQRITGALTGTIQTIRLRMIIEPATNKVEGFYSTDGVTFLNVGAAYETKGLSLAGTNLINSTAYAGLFATHHAAAAPITYIFDDFSVLLNKIPIVVQPPQDQQIAGNKLFSFSAGEYADPDAQDVLKYTATLADGSALPAWLTFDSTTLLFSGTTPPNRASLMLKVTATDPQLKSVSATFKLIVNSPPAVVQVLPDKVVHAGQPFSFTAGLFKDADTDDALSYSATLADNKMLPAWLSFNQTNLNFSGTPPAGGITYAIKVTATDQMQAAATDTFNLKVNTIPTIVQTPVDHLFDNNQNFTIPAGQYADVDRGDVLTYGATLANGQALPSWLQFNSSDLTFSGTTPGTDGNYAIKITATDPYQASVSATLQITVQNASITACAPISPLRCNELGVSLPFELDFTGSEAGLTDVNGLGTGFTMADAYSGTRLPADGNPADIQVRGHQPAMLTLTDGKLIFITNKGTAALTSNNQVNALGVQVNSRNVLVLETTIIKPFNGTSGQQAGLWFGLNDKTFVRLLVTGNKVELRKEVNDVSNNTVADQRITNLISGLDNQTVRLKLIINPATSTAEGFYSTDGSNFLNVGAAYSARSLSLSGSGLINAISYAGVYATHHQASAAVTYTFEEFRISPSLTVVNANPVVVQAPANQVIGAGRIFSFSAGKYADPDKSDVLTYTAVKADGSALPAWLKFNSRNLLFSGTAPVAPASLTVRVSATDPKQAVISADFNIEVQDTGPLVACEPISMLPCSLVPESQSVKLTFDGNAVNSIADKNNIGTGFTMVNNYSGTRPPEDGEPTFAPIPGYEPTNITLSNGRLHLVTNKGIALEASNNQLNALGVRVDNHGKIVQIETTLINPYSGGASQQAGVWFGLNDKTFVRLAVIGNKVELRKEENDVSGNNATYQRITPTISGLNTKIVYLRLVLDLAANKAEGFYSTDGLVYNNVGAGSAYPAKWLSILNMGLKDNPVYGGIYGTYRNGASPVTYIFEDFTLEASLRPYVSAVRPTDGTVNMPLDASVSVELVYPSGKSINGNTVNTNTVKLYTVEIGGGKEVAGTAVNATAAGDAITLSAPLETNTTYEFLITDQVKDGNNLPIIPFSSRFTTMGAAIDTTTSTLTGVAFEEYTLIDSSFRSSGFTSLVIGPDHRLYAATSEGIIERWDIKPDGAIQNRVTINLFGMEKRLLIGFHFDPAATASNLIAWISHSSGLFINTPSWSGKISKVDITNPANPDITDYIINLPRSFKDHTTNSIDFGPDKALYITQGSNSAMGDADGAWGNRPETLLTAAILRLDLDKAQNYVLPINVKTQGPDGTYNPYAPEAPLTIYATGVRNAYDLVWHSNGELYVPTNGSAAGGNTPALKNGTVWSNGQVYTRPDIPALKDIRQTMNDYLFRIEKGGYYGHPNILRNEYILNGGNPTDRQDPGEITGISNGVTFGYPVGTPTEPNYRGWAYDFGVNISPNGVIEYQSNQFGGKLKGKLLVCRFSGKDDIIALEPGKVNKNIIQATEGINIPGFRRPFSNPLDLAEDVRTGNLYLSEYYDGNGAGHPRLTLLKVKTPSAPVGGTDDSTTIDTDKARQMAEANMIVFPNPGTGGVFNVALTNFGQQQKVSVSIYDVSGRAMHTKTIVTNEAGAFTLEFNMKNKLDQGVYIIKARSAHNIRVKKLLVQ